jgi:hypothetical protein
MATKGLAKQTKTLSERQIEATLALLSRNRRPERDTVAFLMSVKAVIGPAPHLPLAAMCSRRCSYGNTDGRPR